MVGCGHENNHRQGRTDGYRKALRDRLGLGPGPVEVHADGTGIRVEPLAAESLAERGARLVIPPSGAVIDDETVRSLRDGDQR